MKMLVFIVFCHLDESDNKFKCTEIKVCDEKKPDIILLLGNNEHILPLQEEFLGIERIADAAVLDD